MPVEFPMILVAKKEFLESFQEGNMYMCNSLKYQYLESEDTQREDKYDSAIKCGFDGFDIPEHIKKNTINPRLMFSPMYIKCFFHYGLNDRQIISSSQANYTIAADSIEELKSFGEFYALLIYDTTELIKRFISACEENNYNYFYSDVSYVNDEEYLKYEEELRNTIVCGIIPEKMTNPAFLKRIKYKPQQEFRFVIMSNGEEYDEYTKEKALSFKMQDIKDISIIVELKQLTDYPLVFDMNKGGFLLDPLILGDYL